ncbi:MAG: NAD+ synthase [Desulfobulbus sp.]|nr:NAD+ synthase [Desulfobulbus sp.]
MTKIAIVQTNPLIGAFERNLRQVLLWIDKAKQACCDLVVFPELTLSGYPPHDFLERASFLEAHDRALVELITSLEGITCVVGVPERREGPGKPLYNSALVLHSGKIAVHARKQLIPSHCMFDETRYFEPGTASAVFPFKEMYCGLTLGEDIFPLEHSNQVHPLAGLAVGPVMPDILINIAAAPYYFGKLKEHQSLFSQMCRQYNMPLFYVNQVGAQDGLVFDGHSMVVTAKGGIHQIAAGYTEDMLIVDSDNIDRAGVPFADETVAQVYEALVLGVRDYSRKTGLTRAVLGLSGGIDSAVVAVIGCDALGAENVLGVALPSPYTAGQSVDDARKLAENTGCDFEIISISAAMEVYQASLATCFAGYPEDTTEQNIQSRIRGNLLMALSNKFNRLLLTASNKSELAMGYCTLYGDMSGGLAVIADVPKTMVYDLARYINKRSERIPEQIILRPPTAELKPGQYDQDDLPPYDMLDAVLHAYLEEGRGVKEIASLGFDTPLVRDIIRKVKLNAYKRQQAPPSINITTTGTAPGRRYPLAHGFVE